MKRGIHKIIHGRLATAAATATRVIYSCLDLNLTGQTIRYCSPCTSQTFDLLQILVVRGNTMLLLLLLLPCTRVSVCLSVRAHDHRDRLFENATQEQQQQQQQKEKKNLISRSSSHSCSIKLQQLPYVVHMYIMWRTDKQTD